MIPLAEAKRTLFCVRSATKLVRVLTFVSIVIDILTLFVLVDVKPFIIAGGVICGFAGLTQPLLMSCVYRYQPSSNAQQTSTKCTKYFLYVWLFILTLTVGQFVWHSLDFLFTLLNNECFPNYPTPYTCDATSADIVLAIVGGCVTGLMLTVINLYTFCILHKNGLCFLYSISSDVEQANVSIQVSYGSAGTTASAPPDETSRILPPSHSVAVNSPDIASDFYVGNDREGHV